MTDTRPLRHQTTPSNGNSTSSKPLTHSFANSTPTVIRTGPQRTNPICDRRNSTCLTSNDISPQVGHNVIHIHHYDTTHTSQTHTTQRPLAVTRYHDKKREWRVP